MKQFYFSILLIFGFTSLSIAQNTVTVDASAAQNGYANVFETPANGGGFVFGQAWGVPDLKTVVDASANTLTLQPNYNNWGDGTDGFWVDQGTGLGNKNFEANTYVEDNLLVGSELTFEGSVSSYNISSDYQVLAFIKVFNADFSFLKQENFEIVATGDFSVSYTNVEASDAVVQYGFQVLGLNANPTEEASLGSVIVESTQQELGLPLTFEGGQLPAFGDFNGSSTQVITNPDASGINTTANVAENTVPGGASFAGVGIGVPINLTNDKYFKMQVWSPVANTPVLLKLEGGPPPVERQVTTTTTGAWEEIIFDFSAEGAVEYTTAVIFMNFNVVDGATQTYYWDNLELFTPPPPPLALPLTFEGGQLPAFGDFNGSSTQVITNPDASGINTTANVAENTVPGGASFAGVGIGVPINLTNDKYFKMQVWSPVANTPVLLKLEGGPPPVERQVTTTTTGAWEEIIFDFSAEGAVEYTTAVIFMNFNVVDGATQTYYWDNLELFTPPPPPLALPLTFEGGQLPAFGDFNGSSTQVITNPDASGINTTANVAENTVPGGASFAGVGIGVPINLTNDKYFKMQVWSPVANTPVLLKLEGGPPPVERQVTTTTTGAWEEIIFDFSAEGAVEYTTAVIFMNFNVVDGATQTYYWDNLELFTPPPPPLALPLTFEGGQLPAFGDFNGSSTQVITNPDASGINTTANVAENTVPGGASFAGVGIGVPINLTNDKYFKMQVWSPVANTPVLLKLEGGPPPVERQVTTTTTGAWEEIIFDFSAEGAVEYTTAVIFMNFNVVDGATQTYYWDNLELFTPPPPPGVNLPITFENEDNPNFQDFNGSETEVISNPFPDGLNPSENVAQNIVPGNTSFAGVSFDVSTIDLSLGNTFNLDVRAILPDAPILLKLENTVNGTSIEREIILSTVNEWENITFDFSTEANANYDKVTLFMYFNSPLSINRVAYWDNLKQNLNDLVELPVTFESATADYNVIGFEGADSAVEANPDPSGINTSNTVVRTTKTEGAAFFAGTGMGLDVPIDFSETESISIKTWSPKADIPVRLKLEGPGGEFIELDVNTTVENEWETLTWDFSGQTAGVDWLTVVIFFEFVVDLPGDGSTYYYDDIDLAPQIGDLVELPVTFESATADYNVIGFEGADSAVEANPDPSGINTSNTVVRTTKTEGAAFFAGTGMGLDVPIDFSETESISIKTWSPKADIPVRLKLEGPGGEFIELDVNTTVENEWETLTWDFSGQTAGVDWLTVVIFFEFVVDLPGDGSTYYYDDIELALPVSDLVELPVTFESATADYNVIGFEGADSAVEANPDPSGINTSNTVVRTTKTEGAAFFAGTGMGLDVPIDFSETESISIKTWSPKADIPVRLKLEGPGGEFIELDVNTTVENEWETLTWDFSGQTAGVDWLTVVIFFEFVVDLPGDGSTYYYDDIELALPVSDLVELPVTFESATADYNVIGFEGADSAVEANPDPSGINTSNTVVRTTKTEGAAFFAGTGMGLDVPIDFSETESISIKTWSPKADIPVRLKLEGPGGEFIELDVNTTVENEWETLTWDFSGQTAGVDWLTVVIFFEFVVDLPGDGSTYYYDDIELAESTSELNAPISFEPGEFGNTWTWTVFENDDNPPLEIIANPDPSGVNTSNTVAKFTARAEGQPFAGVESLHGADLGVFDLTSETSTVTIMVWKTKISDVGIKFATPSGGAQPEIKVANTLINQWEEITFDFSDYIGLPETTGLDQIIIFPDFIDREADDIIYFDNITIGSSVSTPLQLPVDFESTTIDYNVIGFEGADSAVEANPDPSGINTSNTVVRTTKTEGAAFFAGTGMGLDVPIDFSETESISIKTWSPKADIPVRLKLEGPGGEFIELDVNTTVENEWETLTWDFSGQTAGVDWLTVVIFFEFVVDLPGDGSTYYYDDIELALPVSDLVELPVTFESATADYNVIGFEGADSAVEANPDPSGINTSNTVVRTTKTEGAAFFAGTGMGLDVPIDFSETESISIKTWSPKADIPVRLKLEGPGGEFIELDVNTTVENEWETLTWDFSGQTAGVDWLTVVIFFEFVVDLPGDGSTYYYDDIELAAPLSIGDTVLSTVVSFPNPVKTLWNVNAQETITDIIIYNLFGQKILSISPNMSDVSLNMSEMRTGVYLAHVYSDKGTKIIKILKE